MATPEIPHSVQLLRAAEQGVPVFALSNFGADSFRLPVRIIRFWRSLTKAISLATFAPSNRMRRFMNIWNEVAVCLVLRCCLLTTGPQYCHRWARAGVDICLTGRGGRPTGGRGIADRK